MSDDRQDDGGRAPRKAAPAAQPQALSPGMVRKLLEQQELIVELLRGRESA